MESQVVIRFVGSWVIDLGGFVVTEDLTDRNLHVPQVAMIKQIAVAKVVKFLFIFYETGCSLKD